MAGGDTALRKAKEWVEDSQQAGADDLATISPHLDPIFDTAIGIQQQGMDITGILRSRHTS